MKLLWALCVWGVSLFALCNLSYRINTSHAPGFIDYELMLAGLGFVTFKISVVFLETIQWLKSRDWRMAGIVIRFRFFSVGFTMLKMVSVLYAITLFKENVYGYFFKTWNTNWRELISIVENLIDKVHPLIRFLHKCSFMQVYVALGVIIGMVIALIWIILANRKNHLHEQIEMSILKDDPCTSRSDDSLGREPYIWMLMSLVMSKPCSRFARFVGVYAPWGEGKTSIRNFLEERICNEFGKGAAIFIDFHPWGYPQNFDLAIAFFDLLAKALRNKGRVTLSAIIRSYARVLSLRRDSINAGSLHKAFEYLFKFFLNFIDEDSIRRDLEYVFSREKSRVIIVIDDLERMPADDVCRVIRFLKANGDMPGLLYLILSDERHLELSMAKMVVCENDSRLKDAREYLKKIVPIRCPLPRISPGLLKKELSSKLTELKRYVDFPCPDDEEAVSFVLKKISNLRDLKKYLNALLVQLFVFKRLGRFNVHFGDLMALTIIKEIDPELYAGLWSMYWKVFSDTRDSYNVGGVDEKWMEEFINNHVGVFGKEELFVFIKDRLGIQKVSPKSDKKPYFSVPMATSSELMYDYRLSSCYCFDNYFLTETEQNHLEQKDLKDILSYIVEGRIPETLIFKLDHELKLGILLFALESQPIWSIEKETRNYIDFLLWLGRRNLTIDAPAPDFANNVFSTRMTIYTRVFRCLSFYCSKVHKDIINGKIRWPGVAGIGDVLLERVALHNNVYVVSELLNFDMRAQMDNIRGAFFSAEQYTKLEDCFLTQVYDGANLTWLLGHVHFHSIINVWMRLLKSRQNERLYNKFREVMNPFLSDEDSVQKVLLPFISEGLSAYNSPVKNVLFNISLFIEMFGDNALNKALETLEKLSNLDEIWFHAIIVIRWICEHDSPSEQCSPEKQSQYLFDYSKTDKYKRSRERYLSSF